MSLNLSDIRNNAPQRNGSHGVNHMEGGEHSRQREDLSLGREILHSSSNLSDSLIETEAQIMMNQW